MNQFKRALKMNKIRLLKKIFCFEEIYTIAYRNRNGKTLLDSDLLDFNRIPYSDTCWYADPILVSYQGAEYLFMESFDMRTQLGSIALAKFDEAGKLSEPGNHSGSLSYVLSHGVFLEWGSVYDSGNLRQPFS